ncbi:Cytochrome C oxidase assembly protein COX11 [Daphnia magna]|uniref:Cytochrome C oxidase assembly protein COX11 n=1 Tax=Daphnia magna TaxID=35525 RepID=A0A164XBG4_9CRUS|nr:Cytochrome C oxidase assembly protein COX11 [Daphnia magna]
MLLGILTFTSKLPNLSKCFRITWLNSGPVHNTKALVRSFTTTRCCNSHQHRYQGGVRNKSTVYYVIALGVLVGGLSYAAVPLYRLFCQSYSYGGTTSANHSAEGLENIVPNSKRILKIRFNADTSSSLTWDFKPQQAELKVALGETALAFYTATNRTNRPIDGVDMPVFFYIDPDFGEDPRMENIESITLSYTFFEAKEGAALVKPPYAK